MAANAQWSNKGHGSVVVLPMGRRMFRSMAVAIVAFVTLSLIGIV